MDLSRETRLIALDPETAPLWFALEPPGEAVAPALDHMRQVLAGGALNPCLLAVALAGDVAVARFQAALDEAGRLGIWAPEFREGLDPETQARCVDAFLRHCLAHADAPDAALYAETELPDSFVLPPWRAALLQHGFNRVGGYRLYDRSLAVAPPEAEDAPLEWRAFETLPEPDVAALLGAIRGDSHDRTHQLAPESAEVQLYRLMTLSLLDPDRSGWRIAWIEGQPAGLIFTSIENEAYGTPGRGWILEIGVMPQFRGRGLSKILLRRGLADLRARGAQTARARIDDENTPSIRLHQGSGFESSGERYEVWWRFGPSGLRRQLGALWRTLTGRLA